MHATLASETDTLVNLGWNIKTQTDTTVSLETRSPFNWWIFLFCLLIFFGFGALIYTLYWLIASRNDIFLRMDGETVAMSGDVWVVQRQKANLEAAIAFQRNLKERGFWSAAGPSLIAALITIVVWFLIIWGFVALIS